MHRAGSQSAEHEEGAAAEPVYKEECGAGENEVDRSQTDRTCQRGAGSESEHFKNTRSVVVDCVDSGNLIEHCDRPGEENGPKIFFLEKRNVLAVRRVFEGFGDLLHRFIRV